MSNCVSRKTAIWGNAGEEGRKAQEYSLKQSGFKVRGTRWKPHSLATMVNWKEVSFQSSHRSQSINLVPTKVPDSPLFGWVCGLCKRPYFGGTEPLQWYLYQDISRRHLTYHLQQRRWKDGSIANGLALGKWKERVSCHQNAQTATKSYSLPPFGPTFGQLTNEKYKRSLILQPP